MIWLKIRRSIISLVTIFYIIVCYKLFNNFDIRDINCPDIMIQMKGIKSLGFTTFRQVGKIAPTG